MSHIQTICVVGLGYVGLPLAVALSKHFEVTGYDTSHKRIEDLHQNYDFTGEVSPDELVDSPLELSTGPLVGADIYIITVPTPVDDMNAPDLTPLANACKAVGSVMKEGSIVVFESTVYPGVTEDFCEPLLRQYSDHIAFHVAYSPERVNPGDREHKLSCVTKIVAASEPAIARQLAGVYGHISGEIHIAPSIRVAEAAKVIENAQRDINIAFINEITMIFSKMDINTFDVLDAARTKWNFLDFRPGLVGGHCIGVDPFYLAQASMRAGHVPEIILAGRRTNDGMSKWFANEICKRLQPDKKRVLVLGATFKENVPDMRNSKALDLIDSLISRGCTVDVYDPVADYNQLRGMLDNRHIRLLSELPAGAHPHYHAVVEAVAHTAFQNTVYPGTLLYTNGLFADLKGTYRGGKVCQHYRYWCP